LLAMFLPAFAILSIGATTAFTTFITRRTGQALLARSLPALAGAILGSLASGLGTIVRLRRDSHGKGAAA
jgi:hypothetical protein